MLLVPLCSFIVPLVALAIVLRPETQLLSFIKNKEFEDQHIIHKARGGANVALYSACETSAPSDTSMNQVLPVNHY